MTHRVAALPDEGTREVLSEATRRRISAMTMWRLFHPPSSDDEAEQEPRLRAEAGPRSDSEFCTAREIADLLGTSPRWVLDKYRADEIPGHRLPGSNRIRFLEAEVRAAVSCPSRHLEVIREER